MTTAESLCKIPDIVNRAIPLTPYEQIKDETLRKVFLENARWRRSQLTKELTSLLIQNEGNQGPGITINLNDD